VIKVLLFAGLQDAMQQHELELEYSSLTVLELKNTLKQNYPKLPSLDNVMVAVNEEYVMEQETTVKNGDTVALIPPVSGG
jgi:sulfur-carrier protein